ncbi:MAG: hypothetical protein A2360_02720 [Candidatus Staskawiczbacteria bacterium RIFOXYB1_FULL_32_11]|uniref:Uncharacterized protein n=1 Tax=Candidatus Staskawiczbacteria bacterium RIFOXYD1_FULL_32_13 TaxID=1802234 RepID=A0A1G2JMH5_9BACT|nr:MAG: hypothetical protein A2360_02720 [Candidatus Staskawiczbacteria bacterium RIFOXYB1_FULL_32_11]OGZ80963.1 MAG: hypothetical protein A2256_00395 [Candidatus Staskawiczbacteria bacterium RIFOXYA2_FULL_32_7]OGZ87510.1 MAG: hypothetical protein A2561_00775 [Candidatus Staskawiczbacteria bacterium RIFOXYD1_FULL_32_13]
MKVSWVRWEQTEDQDIHCSEEALIEAINAGLDSSTAREKFIALWKYWWKKFPKACVLATMTQSVFRSDGQQLRLWFGDPAEFGSQHVDSSGHNLIVSLRDEPEKLRHLVKEILPADQFEESAREPDDKARCTVPAQIIVWKRKQ